MRIGMTIVVTVLVVIALLAAGALVFRASGMMNVSAVARPGKLERFMMGGVADRSIEKHAPTLQVSLDPLLPGAAGNTGAAPGQGRP
jgi:hypothetical protein